MKEKNFKRKFLAATLGALIVVNIMSLCDLSVVKLGNFSANLNSDEITTSVDDVTDETRESLKQDIIYALDNFETKIPLSDYNITTDVFSSIASEVLEENPQYFYIAINSFTAGYSLNKYNSTGLFVASSATINYPENGDIEAIKNKINFVSETADKIVSGIDDSMSDIEKALYVHDYLALNYKYDERIHSSDPNERSQSVFDIYNFFSQGTGVCQAYTTAYKYIMQYKLGIPSKIVISSSMGHAWNIIYINGNWYHVDVTWDDPTPDMEGTVNHNYFLMSDEAMLANDHHDWRISDNKTYSCSDTSYDSYWWHDVSTEIYRIDGKWYSVDNEGEFAARDVNTGETDTSSAASFSIERDRWYAWNSSTVYWCGNYTVLIKSGTTFFYNTTENVYAINADGSNKRLVANIPKSEHNGYQIFGLGIDENNNLYAILQNNPQDTNDENGNTVAVQKEIYNIANIADIDSIATPVDSDSSDTEDIDWNQVNQIISQDSSVEVSLSSENATLPSDVVENAKGKDVNIIVNIGSYQWTVNGLDVSDGNVADVNLGVNENKGIVPENITDKYTDGQKTVEVNLDYEGQFGYTANLKIYVGKEYAGKTASILHYDTENARLAYQGVSTVDSDGNAELPLRHASSYMLVIDDKPVGLPGDLNADGNVDLTDYMRFKQYLIGQSSDIKLVNADVDGDNRITIKDAVLVSKQLLN